MSAKTTWKSPCIREIKARKNKGHSDKGRGEVAIVKRLQKSKGGITIHRWVTNSR